MPLKVNLCNFKSKMFNKWVTHGCTRMHCMQLSIIIVQMKTSHMASQERLVANHGNICNTYTFE
jgi:hypothetical protein